MKNSLNDATLQKRLRADDKSAMEWVYSTYRNEFLGFAIKYGLGRDAAVDIYQDAVVAMYQNFAIKNLTLKSGSVKTYLFSIGKFKVFKLLKKQNLHLPYMEQLGHIDMTASDDIDKNEYHIQLEKGLTQLSEQCIKVIRLFYYRNLSIEEIVDQTDYKDGNTVRSHKSRCMKKLKQLVLTL